MLDLGCGTGRFSELLAEHFGVLVIAIDPSRKMLDQARSKRVIENVVYQQGSAEALPLQDGSADLVFMSNVYHHLNDPAAVVLECHRVLRQAGYVCIRNGTRELDFPQRPFFPGLEPLIASDIPSRRDIESAFATRGFIRTTIRSSRKSRLPTGQPLSKSRPSEPTRSSRASLMRSFNKEWPRCGALATG